MTIQDFLMEQAERLRFDKDDSLPPKAELLRALCVLYEADCSEMRFNELATWLFGASGYYDDEEIKAFCDGVMRGQRAMRDKPAEP